MGRLLAAGCARVVAPRSIFRRALGAAGLVLGSGAAYGIEVQYTGMNRVLTPTYYDNYGVGITESMRDGNVAMIDDWYHNSLLVFSEAVVGDSFGIRVTLPGGIQRLNTLSYQGSCWISGVTTWCPASRSGSWELGTRVRFEPTVGQWRVEALRNGATVSTHFFELRAYSTGIHGGTGQSIPALATTPMPLSIRVSYPDGSAAPAGKEVQFSVTSRPGGANPPGGLSGSSTYTGSSASTLTAVTAADGVARVYLDTGGRAGSYVVQATSPLAPGASHSFTVTASATDALSGIDAEKNLGENPVAHSGCAAATAARTDKPISIATGNEVVTETDYAGGSPFPLRLTRYYNSLPPRAATLGPHWRHWYDRSIGIVTVEDKGKTSTYADMVRPDGRVLRFTLSNGVWVAPPDAVDRLENLAGGGYRYVCGDDNVEVFSSSGRLVTLSAREGFTQVLEYDTSQRLSRVTDAFGRTLRFIYNTAGVLARVRDPANQAIDFGYHPSGNLAWVRYPDLTRRLYHYENTGLPRALTGITDERGARLVNIAYDAGGRAVASGLAGGVQQSAVTYFSNGRREVTDAEGNVRRYDFAEVQGVARRTGVDNAACLSCGNAQMLTSYNSAGFVSGFVNYRGFQTTFVRNGRGLETSRTEAAGTADARSITTTWSPTFRLPVTITEPGRRTEFTYDANGRLRTQAHVDTGSGARRQWTFDYDARGLLASVDGPRSDVADITRYTYDAHGNVATEENALGHTRRWTAYDVHGRPLSMTDPNGLVTTMSYDLRGRLLTRDVGGLVTRHAYDAAGLLTRTSHPDGTWTDYEHDAAQRLVGVRSNTGERIAYTLDRKNGLVREEVFDASGTSVRVRRWTRDPQGRVADTFDADDRLIARLRHDANGNVERETDALDRHTSRTYDGLDRLVRTTDPFGGRTVLSYDPRDNLVRVEDPLNVPTNYTFDGLDRLLQESGPDAGASVFGVDIAGLTVSRSWANGRAVTYTHDALGRRTREDYGGGVVVTYGYDDPAGGNAGIGRPTSMTDPTGSTTWRYDLQGRLLQKTQTTGTRVLATSYAYDAATGRLQTLTYPSGRVMSYSYGTDGRLASLSYQGQSVVSAVQWQPFGPPTGWTQGNGRVVVRNHDRNGRLTGHSLEGGLRGIVYDVQGRIERVEEPGRTLGYAYDAADRLAGEAGPGWAKGYGYDANGNRVAQTDETGTTTYALVGGSNRLLAAGGAQARAFEHDAAGLMTRDGSRVYVHDARNRLAGYGSWTYGYNGLGQRVSKTSTNTRTTAYDEAGQVLGEYAASSTLQETIRIGDLPVAMVRGGVVHWIDSDQLGSPRAILDAAGRTMWRWETEAFGTTAASDMLSGSLFEYNLRLPGQVFDKESGLHYNYFRDYRPALGRYAQTDPIGLRGGINTYTYVGGNPLSYTDPNGLCPCGTPASVIGAARSDTRDWSRAADRTDVNSGFGEGTYKCNLYADTQYEAAGYNLPNIGGGALARALGKYPPGAQSLSSSSYSVPGWPVVSGPAQAGDLIAYLGHVGIVTGPGRSISASPGGVVENDWGSRSGQTPVIRRCSCGG